MKSMDVDGDLQHGAGYCCSQICIVTSPQAVAQRGQYIALLQNFIFFQLAKK
jgi:hypothetical protein